MPIQSGDMKLLKSAVMADVPEGGGAPTGTVIADGVSNAIFPDVSELDRAGGRVNLRKVFAKVDTDDVDTYMGTNVIVAEPPSDPRVSVTLFSTESTFDDRDDARTRIESFLTVGPPMQQYLYGDHLTGQRTITLLGRENQPLPVVGASLVLRATVGGAMREQYVRVTAVSATVRTFTHSETVEFKRNQITVDISDALRFDFPGHDQAYFVDSNISYTNRTRIFETVVADAARYFGVVPLTEAAGLGDFTIDASSVYTQLVPSAQVETPIADARTNQQMGALTASGGPVVQTLSHAFTTASSMFIGGGFLPGSLSVERDGITLTDKGGALINAADLGEVGTCDYANGVMSLTTNVWGTGAGTFTVTFTPAEAPTVISKSFGIPVEQETQRLSYVVTLNPPPAPGSLDISYRSGGRWYVLKENGTGQISGAATGIGVGTLNYGSGTMTVTLGALPDVGTKIILGWAPKESSTPISTVIAGSTDPLKNRFYFTLALRDGPLPRPIKPGSLSITWNDGTERTVTDNSLGVLGGYGVGNVNYQGGVIRLSPTTLPPKGTEITVSITDTVLTQVDVNTFTDSGANWSFSLGGYAQSGAVEFAVVGQHVVRNFPDIDSVTPRVLRVFDDSAGNLVVANITGNLVVGTINYVTGACTLVKSVAGFKDVQRTWSSYNPIDDGQPAIWTQRSDETRTLTLTILNGPASAMTAPPWAWWTGQLSVAAKAQYGAADGGPEVATFTPETIYAQGRWRRFQMGGSVYVASGDNIQRDPLPGTGVGTVVGWLANFWDTDINYSLIGNIRLSEWTAGIAPSFTYSAGLITQPLGGVTQTTSRIVFRTAVAPIRNGSFSLVGTMQSGQAFNITADSAGVINATVANSQWVPSDFPLTTPGSWSNPTTITGTVNYETGVVEVEFGAAGALADTLRYNATAYTYLPLDADILGLDPVRLPQDGRVPIFRSGEFAVVGHTASLTATVSNAQTIDCARVRLSRVRVIGADGLVINSGYTTDLEAGTVTFTNVAGYSQPVTIEHRIEDMAMVREVQITGQLTFTRPLTHAYPLGSYVSSALVAGDRFARTSVVFDQATWNGTWSDSAVGSPATASFNAVANPIVVTNRGALTERWAVQFTNSTSFNVIGENVGVIASGNTSADCAPLNPNTGAPYFSIPALGWGLGWSTGNLLRFNTIGAEFPVWVVRTVQQGPETVPDDSFTILIRGDVDTP